MGLEITDVPAAFGADARASCQADAFQGLAHGAIAVAVMRGVDFGFRKRADKGSAAEEGAEMAFLVAPGCDFHRAGDVWIRVQRAGGFQRVDHAERAIEPAGMVLAFKMR